MKNRALALDSLRGYAIITMVLSGTIVTGVLPQWMSHAQIFAARGFDPSVAGITWVDLVFPFFIFAMGAALPFSLGGRLERGDSKWKLTLESLLRGLKLAYFAIFLQHIYPHVVSSPMDTRSFLIALLGFVLLFGMYLRIPLNISLWARRAIEYVSFGLGLVLMLSIDYANDRVFSLGWSNIIIMVLANMAIFGSIIYIFTANSAVRRVAVLPFVMGVILTANSKGMVYMGGAQGWIADPDYVATWVDKLYSFSPAGWMYQFAYLKYLFVLIPGTIAGEYLKQWCQKSEDANGVERPKTLVWVVGLSLLLIVLNLYGLYTRSLTLNLVGTIVVLVAIGQLLKGEDSVSKLWHKLFILGAFLLLLGLTFEGYEGGIRKDHSTFSYYFTTSGLASFALIFFSGVCDVYRVKWLAQPLQKIGQNPMIAYVSPQLVVTPLLGLTGAMAWVNSLNTNAFEGCLRGLIFTSLAVVITVIFTRFKLFWRT